jgi:hypothetical protein
MNKNKDGKLFESLVAIIEQAKSTSPNLSFETHKRISDRITGESREIDILITITAEHHKVFIAIECRDHRRPITINQVEGFITKCSHTGINKGIFVSSTGFTKSALKKANFYGIDSLTLKEISNVSWLVEPKIRLCQRRIVEVNFIFIHENIGGESLTDIPIEDIRDKDGKPFSKDYFVQTIRNEFNKNIDELEKGSNLQYDEFNGFPCDGQFCSIIFLADWEGIFFVDTKSERLLQIQRVQVMIKYKIVNQDIPLTLLEYRNDDDNSHIADIAIFPESMNIRGKDERLLIIGIGEGKIKIGLVPTSE